MVRWVVVRWVRGPGMIVVPGLVVPGFRQPRGVLMARRLLRTVVVTLHAQDDNQL
ncbi:hypothetical protein ABH937_002274 [Kitasatospora sp. GAS1066B]